MEKPAAPTLEELEKLVRRAHAADRHFVEDYNYLFNRAPQEILRLVKSGEFGMVTHVEVLICLDILGPGGFADPNSPHPVLALAGAGAIGDFLPHRRLWRTSSLGRIAPSKRSGPSASPQFYRTTSSAP